MVDWPELEEARRRKLEAKNQSIRQMYEAELLRELEGKADELFVLKERLERWDSILAAVQDLGREWGQPVYDLLEAVARTTWDSLPYNEKGLTIQFKLVLPEGCPPELLWELRYTRLWYMGWFNITLRVEADGKPRHFLIECGKPGYLLSSAVDLEKLKAALVQAYELGPVVDLHRKFTKGLDVK